MKLTILTATWKRPEIFELFIDSVKKLKGNISVVVAGSPHDQCELMADKAGYTYISRPNDPLTDKWNAGAHACRLHQPDVVLMMGSDDIYNQRLLDFQLAVMAADIDYSYLTDGYFFDTQTKHALYWGGYLGPHNRGHALGCGRMLSAQLMNAMDWNPWADGFNTNLDTGMNEKLKHHKYTRQAIRCKDVGGVCLDIKSPTNMTPFARWENADYVTASRLLSYNFPTSLGMKIFHTSEKQPA